jgi:hypothetical protein
MTDTIQESVPDPITANVEGAPITAGGDHDKIVESVRELNKRREAEGSLVADEGPTERKWEGAVPESSNPNSPGLPLREATRAISDTHKRELGDQYLKSFGVSNPDPAASYIIADEASKMGRQPSELPMQRVGVATNAGEPLAPVDDRAPYTEADGDNLRNVTRAVTNYRELAAAADAEEVARLEQVARELEWQRLQGEQPPESSSTDTPTSTPEQPAAPRPQPAQDPLAKERAALVAEQRRLAEVNQLSAAEVNLHAQAEQWRVWANSNFPELKDAAQLEHTRQFNPQRYAQLEKADAQIRLRQQKIAELRQGRDLRERQIGEIRSQQQKAALVEYKAAEDRKYSEWANKALPQYRTEKGITQHREYVKKVLRETGLSDAQIQQQWDSGYLRPLGFQQVLAKAAAWEHQRAQMANRDVALAHKRAPAVQPLQPGVFQPSRGGADEADIARAERHLAGAVGERASLRAATQLLQARRSAGRL